MKNNYYIQKDSITGDTIFIEFNNMKGYQVSPKTKNEDEIEVNKIVFVSNSLSEKIIKKKIDKISKNKHKYTFNVIGLFATGINFKYKKKNSYYCAEFVKYILETAKLDVNLPELVKPNDFVNIKNLELTYAGILREYNT